MENDDSKARELDARNVLNLAEARYRRAVAMLEDPSPGVLRDHAADRAAVVAFAHIAMTEANIAEEHDRWAREMRNLLEAYARHLRGLCAVRVANAFGSIMRIVLERRDEDPS